MLDGCIDPQHAFVLHAGVAKEGRAFSPTSLYSGGQTMEQKSLQQLLQVLSSGLSGAGTCSQSQTYGICHLVLDCSNFPALLSDWFLTTSLICHPDCDQVPIFIIFLMGAHVLILFSYFLWHKRSYNWYWFQPFSCKSFYA